MARACSKCERPIGPTATRCIYCGNASPLVTATTSRHGLGDGPFTLTCSDGCGRKNQVSREALERLLERDALNCSFCQSRMQLPPDVVAFVDSLPAPFSRKPVLVTCPGCARKAPTVPREQARCMYCGIGFIAPSTVDAVAAVGPLNGAAVADPDAVQHAVSAMPHEYHCALAARILRARAQRHELAVGEADALCAALIRLADWQPLLGASIHLPLAAEDAEVLVPRVLFGVSEYGVFPRGNQTELLMVLGTKPRVNLPRATGADALNLAAALTLGVHLGLDDSRDRAQVAAPIRIQIYSRFRSANNGVEFKALNQIDQEPTTPLTDAQRAELHARVTACAPILQRYFVLAALLGPSCRAGVAFNISPAAIAQRFEFLAGQAPSREVEALNLRVPPPFPVA